jgi:hypothetical protein
MATLRKTENAENIFTVTVESSIDMTTFAKSYEESNPETDMLTQILAYAKENNWYISQWDTEDELMRQLENNLTEHELLEISDMNLVNEQIQDLASEINLYAGHGIEYLTITKFGDKYELDVTKNDIRKIFLDMIQ